MVLIAREYKENLYKEKICIVMGIFCVLLVFNIQLINAGEYFQIGTSPNKHNIGGYSFGNSKKCVIVIGGIHGRYEENTIYIANRLIDYCGRNEQNLSVTVKIIPNLNPDAFRYELNDPILKTNGSLIRFNGNSVDLNRNWYTPDWRADCVYSFNDVRIRAGGKTPMSEPEIISLSDFILGCKSVYEEIYVITLHSYVVNKTEKGSVFPSYIKNSKNEIEVLESSDKLADIFSHDGSFLKNAIFQNYTVTGEMAYWCGINNIAEVDLEFCNNGDIDEKKTNRSSHWEVFIKCFEFLLEIEN